ncbi:MAG: hypothetical protein PHV06_00715, partial [bacterium]|nr:hypothetical protein [bacterium]
VSRMTGYMESNLPLMKKNLKKVKHTAEIADVPSVLITGKGEPLLGYDDLLWIISEFREFYCELQTNGIYLNNNPELVKELADTGLNVVAISLDLLNDFENYKNLFAAIRKNGMLNRITLNITNKIPFDISFEILIKLCREHFIDQFSLRNIVIPNNIDLVKPEVKKTADWIKSNVNPLLYERLVSDLKTYVKKAGFLIRELPYGAKLYDYEGISVTFFDYCVQDSHNEDDIRSLIFQEDGHLYTTWNSLASRLF